MTRVDLVVAMSHPFKNLPLSLKVGGAIAVVVTIIDLFQLVYYPRRQLADLREALQKRARTLSEVISSQLGPSLEFDDAGKANEILTAAARDADLQYAALYSRAQGKLFAGHQLERAEGSLTFRPVSQPELADVGRLLRVTSPVRGSDGTVGGYMVMGFSTESLARRKSEVRRATLFAGVLVLASGLVVAYFVGRSIGRRLGSMERVADQVAKGDLGTPLLQEQELDEIGRMSRSFDTMLRSFKTLRDHLTVAASGDLSRTTNLQGDLPEAFNQMILSQRELVSEIKDTSLRLTSAANGFMASATAQERGSVEQSSAIEQNRRTVESLTDASRTVATSAEEVLRAAEQTQRNSKLAAERIAELSNQTRRIGEILEVIQGIASKSEILALNAALEGIKSGEAGRGFSLVATQMQKLAENVVDAVKDIKDLTSTITTANVAAVKAMEESSSLASDTTRSARQITLIIQQQQMGMEEMSRAMEDVAGIARETASGSLQVVDASKALVNLSDRLQTLVGKFVVAPEGGAC